MIRLFRRLWPARLGDGAAAAVPAPGAETETIRYVLASAGEDARPRSLISMLGDLPPNAGEMIEAVAAACREQGEFPVAVLSDLRPDLIAASTLPIEFMPTRRYLPVRADEYERHVRRRWALLVAKWEFARQIELSPGFDAFLAAELHGVAAAPARLAPRAGYALASEA